VRRTLLLAGAACLAVPGIAFAQPAESEPPDTAAPDRPQEQATPAASPASNADAPEEQQIIVTGYGRRRADILSGTSVVSGDDLARDQRSTIGDTLARLPGVSTTSFGPNASRPVLRGFQGDRIRILTDGIGSLDVSGASADHAVSINPLTADSIEVLRGPAALLFGSSAIGGVVNVVDSRIPRRVPADPVRFEGILNYNSAANERSGNAKIDVPAGSRFVIHADGSYNQTDDLRVGGYLLTPALRAQAAATSARSRICAAGSPTQPARHGMRPRAPPGSMARAMRVSR
jgi:iron complex outermembrane recepter protein